MNSKKNPTHMILHRHEYGTSHAFIHTKRNPFAMDDSEVEDACKQAGLDYELEKEEEIEFVAISSESVTVIE